MCLIPGSQYLEQQRRERLRLAAADRDGKTAGRAGEGGEGGGGGVGGRHRARGGQGRRGKVELTVASLPVNILGLL